MESPTIEIANSSALQLYHTAYRSHYEANDIKEACRLYREIIRQFPDSNECAYAVVQLEKIGSKEVLKSLHNTHFHKVLPLAALLISLFALFIAVTTLFLVLDTKSSSWYNDNAPSYCHVWHERPSVADAVSRAIRI